eukprot:4475306-Prymnesium_polylepis.1
MSKCGPDDTSRVELLQKSFARSGLLDVGPSRIGYRDVPHALLPRAVPLSPWSRFECPALVGESALTRAAHLHAWRDGDIQVLIPVAVDPRTTGGSDQYGGHTESSTIPLTRLCLCHVEELVRSVQNDQQLRPEVVHI